MLQGFLTNFMHRASPPFCRPLSNSVSVTPATPLVNGARYILTIEYRDTAGNAASQQAITVRFDTSTEAPTLAPPGASSSVLQNFTLRYTLTEPAGPGTATVTMSRTGGEVDSAAARVIVLADSVLAEGVGSNGNGEKRQRNVYEQS